MFVAPRCPTLGGVPSLKGPRSYGVHCSPQHAPIGTSQEAAVAIIRLSGDEALRIAARIFRQPQPRGGWKAVDPTTWASHRVYYGHVVDEGGGVVDEVLLLVMKQPRSYTKEDVVEVHCHGGHVCVDRVLHTCVSAGAMGLLPLGALHFRMWSSCGECGSFTCFRRPHGAHTCTC